MTLPYYLSPQPQPDYLLTDNYLVLDFETTSIEKGSALNADNRLLMAAWYYRGQWKHRWADELDQAELMADIESCDLIVMHNQKFEAHWLKRMGLPYGDKLGYDTMLGDYVIAGNRRMPFDLDSCAKRWGVAGKQGLVSSMMKSGVKVEDIPKRWVVDYCFDDVRSCHDIFLKQRQALKKCGLLNILFTRCILTPVLASMESKGLQLDCDKVQKEYDIQQERYAEIECRLAELVGEVNLNSPQQLAKVLYEDLKFKELRKYGKPDRNAPNKAFPEGQPKTDLSTIKQLKATNKKQREVQALMLDKSKVGSALTKGLNLFKALCEQKGGIFYGTYMQHRTATHRLSAVGRKQPLILNGKEEEKAAQLQNIDRTHKRLFKGRNGRLVAEADFTGLEFRVAGILGRDRRIRKDVFDEVDVHTNCMETLNAAGMDVDRTGAKQYSFRPQYSIVRDVKKPTPADEYAKWYKDRYSYLAQEQERWAQSSLNKKRLDTPWGMKFYFPNCKLTGTGYITDATKSLNYPIQCFGGAEIMSPSIVYLYHATKDIEGIDLINTVHDSICAEVAPEKMELFAELCADSMLEQSESYCKSLYSMEFYVPLGIGISAGEHWSEDSLSDKSKTAVVANLQGAGYEKAEINDKGEISIFYHESAL